MSRGKYGKRLKSLEDLRILCEDPDADEEVVLELAARFAMEQTASTLGFISVVDFADAMFLQAKEEFMFRTKEAWRYQRRHRMRIGGEELPRTERSISGYVAATRRPYRCDDVKQDPYYYDIDDDVRSEWLVPILHKERVLGVLTLQSYRPSFYNKDQEHWLCRVATLMEAPMARWYEHQQAQHYYDLALRDFGALAQEVFSTSRDFLSAVLEQIAKRIEVHHGFARVVEDKKILVFRASYPSCIQRAKQRDLPENIFWRIGKDLPRRARSFEGYVAAIQQVCRVEELRGHGFYRPIGKTMRSAGRVPGRCG